MPEQPGTLPYVHLLEGRDAAEVLRSTPAYLDGFVSSFPPGDRDTPTAPGKWSVREQICHLADCEVAWAWRLRHTFGEDTPTHTSFEQDAWARAYGGSAYAFQTALSTWRALRIWNLALIDALTPADRQRPAMHPSAGPVTLWALVQIAAGHDLHHIATFDRLIASRSS